jgi:hypothetical protein
MFVQFIGFLDGRTRRRIAAQLNVFGCYPLYFLTLIPFLAINIYVLPFCGHISYDTDFPWHRLRQNADPTFPSANSRRDRRPNRLRHLRIARSPRPGRTDAGPAHRRRPLRRPHLPATTEEPMHREESPPTPDEPEAPSFQALPARGRHPHRLERSPPPRHRRRQGRRCRKSPCTVRNRRTLANRPWTREPPAMAKTLFDQILQAHAALNRSERPWPQPVQ